MSEIQDALLDIYAYEKRVAECSYELLGKMLDPVAVQKGVDSLGASEIYIYGGGYLGIQFYRAASCFTHILAVVDRKKKLAFHNPDILLITPKQLQDRYHGEKIVVASVQYYEEIRERISLFVKPDHIIYLGEIFGGMM